MRELSRFEIVGLELPDCRVLAFSARDGALEFTCDGAFVTAAGLVDTEVEVSIRGLTRASVVRFDAQGEHGVVLDLERSGGLSQICARSFAEGEVRLAGFERRTGVWQEYWFEAPEVRVRVG